MGYKSRNRSRHLSKELHLHSKWRPPSGTLKVITWRLEWWHAPMVHCTPTKQTRNTRPAGATYRHEKWRVLNAGTPLFKSWSCSPSRPWSKKFLLSLESCSYSPNVISLKRRFGYFPSKDWMLMQFQQPAFLSQLAERITHLAWQCEWTLSPGLHWQALLPYQLQVPQGSRILCHAVH